jgi:hypothetical protein
LDKKTILLKEVCHKTSITSNFGGIIRTPIPIHEIYELKQEIKNPRIIVGKKVIACLGEVVVKAYCVKKESFEIFLIEHCFCYRNYISGNYIFHDLKPEISVKSELQGIITESIKLNEIGITGVISTELVFSLEKEYNLSFLQDSISPLHHEQTEKSLISKSHSPGYINQMNEGSEDLITKNLEGSFAYAGKFEDQTQSADIFANVVEGVNQDLTIILE